MSNNNKRIRHCAHMLLSVVDEEEGRERNQRESPAENFTSSEMDYFDLPGVYRGKTAHGYSIGEGCYWNTNQYD